MSCLHVEPTHQHVHEPTPDEIFQHFFRSAFTVSSRWASQTAIALWAGIVLEKAWDRLPILADALEESGCDNNHILSWCRSEIPTMDVSEDKFGALAALCGLLEEHNNLRAVQRAATLFFDYVRDDADGRTTLNRPALDVLLSAYKVLERVYECTCVGEDGVYRDDLGRFADMRHEILDFLIMHHDLKADELTTRKVSVTVLGDDDSSMEWFATLNTQECLISESVVEHYKRFTSPVDAIFYDALDRLIRFDPNESVVNGRGSGGLPPYTRVPLDHIAHALLFNIGQVGSELWSVNFTSLPNTAVADVELSCCVSPRR